MDHQNINTILSIDIFICVMVIVCCIAVLMFIFGAIISMGIKKMCAIGTKGYQIQSRWKRQRNLEDMKDEYEINAI